MDSREKPALVGAIFLCAFVAYQVTLPLFATARYPDFWAFGADNYRVALEHPGTHPAANYQISKHPGFVALALPLHRAAKLLVRPLPEPQRENAALTFPSAVFGALTACVAFLVFRKIGLARPSALLATALYALSAAVWVFASFPDTYACSAFFTALFIWCYVSDPGVHRWIRLAAVHAAACFVGPQQFVLGIIPAAGLLVRREPGRFTRILRYSAALIVVYLVPYIAFLTVLHRPEFVLNETHWATVHNFADPRRYFALPMTFVASATFAPWADLVRTSVRVGPSGTPGIAWLVILVIALYAVSGPLSRRVAPTGGLQALRIELVAFLVAYTLFFIWWRPEEAFLYTAPIQLPLWLVFHIGWLDRQHSRAWRWGMAVAALVVAAGSLRLLWDLRHTAPLFFK
jgi:hypothetical protein